MDIKYTPEKVARIIELYINKHPVKDIQNEFGICRSVMHKILRKNNIKIRDDSGKNQIHKVNENMFDFPLTNEAAYFLGLLFSDGNVHSKTNAITLKLHKKDIDILEKYSLFAMNKVKINYSNENYAIVKFFSKKIKNRLIELGCVPNKSLVLKFPILEEKDYSHFLRGYLDGDGCIHSGICPRAVIVSTKDFCLSAQKLIIDKLGCKSSVAPSNDSFKRGNLITSILSIGGINNILKFLEWIYKDHNYVCLARKRSKYLEILKKEQDKLFEINYKNQQILDMHGAGFNMAQIIKNLHVGNRRVKKLIFG